MLWLVASGNGNGKKKRNLSPETREKLSRLAKERHAAGKFGGREHGKLGGRPKKKRVAEDVVEAAREPKTAQDIINVFKDAIHPNQPIGIRLKAAEAWLGVEREEAKVALQEEAHDNLQADRDELLSILSERLTSGPAAEILRQQMAQRQLEAEIIPDAEVVDGNAED